MNVTITNRGMVLVDGARIIYRNFSGRGTDYNRDGDRNFCLVIEDQETANRLIEEGYNVKIKEPKDPDDQPFMYLKINVKFHPEDSELARLNPEAVLLVGKKRINLDAETIGDLDHLEIENIDMDVSGSRWHVNGKSGKSAYLSKIYVTKTLDRYATRYAEEEYPCE